MRVLHVFGAWPEEMNRQITGRIATYNFSPTSRPDRLGGLSLTGR